VAGEPITEEFTSQFGQTVEVFCANDPSLCVLKVAYVWTRAGAEEFADPSVKAGDVVDLDGLGWPSMCEENPTWCGTSQPTFDYKASSLRYSVLRTGTGDLDLVSGGNLRMDSLYGVYTAGTSSVATAAGDRTTCRARAGWTARCCPTPMAHMNTWSMAAATASTAPGIRTRAAICCCRWLAT
jgi:hypothetical protein